MARPAAAVAPRAGSAGLASASVAVLTLVVLAALLVWPLLEVLLLGLVSGAPSMSVLLFTLAVGVASTVGALGLAALVAATVRIRP